MLLPKIRMQLVKLTMPSRASYASITSSKAWNGIVTVTGLSVWPEVGDSYGMKSPPDYHHRVPRALLRRNTGFATEPA
jgi:hypothetical protein